MQASCILLTVSVATLCSAVQIKVGIYNYIPDLNNDGLQAYKKMIQNDFKEFCQATLKIADCSVDAVVDSNVYNPYGDLSDYLENQGFDMLEIDTGYNLGGLVKGGHIVRIHDINQNLISYIVDNMFPSAVEAVTVTHYPEKIVYALPTLLCGNFITSVDPATLAKCPINLGAATYETYKLGLTICRNNMPTTYETLIVGKMYNGEGGYLPDIYLDGYIDIHGKDSLDMAMQELLNGEVDETLCQRLQQFIGQCGTEPSENVCNGELVSGDFDNATYNRIVGNKSLLMFSFSEKLSTLLQTASNVKSTRQPHGLASVSFGDNENNLLQYVDGLVTGKTQWENANAEKKNVIAAFNKFFIETEIRKRVTTGSYIDPPTNTYLIIPSKKFYDDNTLDGIYRQMVPFLKSAVPAPYISSEDRLTMLNTLTTECVPGYFGPAPNKPKKGKTEL